MHVREFRKRWKKDRAGEGEEWKKEGENDGIDMV